MPGIGSSKKGGAAKKAAADDDLRQRSKARGLLNTSNLPALQNLLKRDPASYRDDFIAQWNHYQSLSRILRSDMGIGMDASGSGAGMAGPSAASQIIKTSKDEHNRFLSLLSFVAQLAPSYPQITKGFPEELSTLLLQHHSALSPDLRLSCVKSLVLLRNKDHISSEELLRTLLPLLSLTTSATLRTFVQKTILSDLKTANLKTKAVKLNSLVQGWLFSLIQKGIEANKVAAAGIGINDTGSAASKAKGKLAAESRMKSEALWAVRLASELWRKNIWRDAKTVQIISEGCFHPHPKVQASCIRFFLGDLHASETANGSDDENDGSDSDETSAHTPDMSKLKHQRKVKKKTRSADRKIKAAAATARKMNKQKEANRGGDGDGTMNAAAIDLLHDPQSFADKLFEMLRIGDKRTPIELKVRIMQLLSRVISLNKLAVLGFYSYVVKYLAPQQLHVTLILVSVAQSVHEQTPPDVLVQIVRKLSDAFVHPGVGPEVIAAGLNTIREVCRRQPSVMEGSAERDLLEDLIAYRKSKDKGVCAASRGLLALYREVNPALLHKRERGKAATMAAIAGEPIGSSMQFGVDKNEVHGIPGLDLLAKHLDEHNDEEVDEADEKGWEGWELESDSDSDSDDGGGWIDVISDEEDGRDGFEISDSEDEDGNPKEKVGDADGPKPSAKERATQWKAQRQVEKARRKAGEVDDEKEESEAVKARREQALKDAQELAERAKAAEEVVMKLATTKILTPADFAKLNELRLASAEAAAKAGSIGSKKALQELKAATAASKKRAAGAQGNTFLDEGDILGPRKKAKADYEERMASIAKGREDRDKFGSKKGKKNKDTPSSTTNEQKKKSKNFQMIQKSFQVRSKKRASLYEKSKKLRKHIDKAKKRTK
ncbi:SDA1-domain-containing protein [Tilletiaria anomala UBC 951]|uniref:Protein SDA1 n=1 Tax=Tilletiaria anomala (strain ATCC 24038 / CBS 436.72 / UBC 951) TaxID=1037660 RepID=A0A066VI36_TILAU|nr:SDA1-domain-containing protein [Tilletiaria anomala UBC 951]KDN38379.1 SDA1-domain-containing protein [Tilletiaria anomala UBC 951]